MKAQQSEVPALVQSFTDIPLPKGMNGLVHDGEIFDVPFPLAPTQRTWLSAVKDWPGMRERIASSTLPLLLRLTGPLDIARLQRAVDSVGTRHIALRTRFKPVDGEMRQLFHSGPMNLVVRYLSAAEQEPARLAEILAADRTAKVDAFGDAQSLSEDLCRITLFVLSETEAYLQFVPSHVIIDFRCVGLIRRQLVTAYGRAEGQGADEDLAQARRYIAYTHWQNSANGVEFLEQCVRAWKSSLDAFADMEVEPLFAADRKPLTGTFADWSARENHCVRSFQCSKEIKSLLDRRSLAMRVPPAAIMLAAVLTTSFMRAGADRRRAIAVTLVSDGCFVDALTALCGNFAGAMPFVIGFEPSRTAADVITEVNRLIATSRPVPLDFKDVFSLRPGTMDNHILATTYFNNFGKAPAAETSGGVTFSTVPVPRNLYTVMPLMVSIKQPPEGTTVEWDGIIGCVEEADLVSLHESTMTVLRAILERPTMPIGSLGVSA